MELPPWDLHFAGLPGSVIALLRPHAAAYDAAFTLACNSSTARDFLRPEFRDDHLTFRSEFWKQNPLTCLYIQAAWYTPRRTAADRASACV